MSPACKFCGYVESYYWFLSQADGLRSLERRRLSPVAGKCSVVWNSCQLDLLVSLLALRQVIPLNPFLWLCRPAARGARGEPRAHKGVVAASEYCAIQPSLHEVHLLSANKTLESEILSKAFDLAAAKKVSSRAFVVCNWFSLSTVSTILKVVHTGIVDCKARRFSRSVSRLPQPDNNFAVTINAAIVEAPTDGDQCNQAILCNEVRVGRLPHLNDHGFFRLMKAHSLLLLLHASNLNGQRHVRGTALNYLSLQRRFNELKFGRDNRQNVHVVFPDNLGYDEKIGFIGMAGDAIGEDVQDLVLITLEARFRQVNRLLHTVEWFIVDGLGYVVSDMKRLTHAIGLKFRWVLIQGQEVQWDGSDLRQNHQARQGPYLGHSRRLNRHKHAADLVRALQSASLMKRPAASRQAILLRSEETHLIISCHAGEETRTYGLRTCE